MLIEFWFDFGTWRRFHEEERRSKFYPLICIPLQTYTIIQWWESIWTEKNGFIRTSSDHLVNSERMSLDQTFADHHMVDESIWGSRAYSVLQIVWRNYFVHTLCKEKSHRKWNNARRILYNYGSHRDVLLSYADYD